MRPGTLYLLPSALGDIGTWEWYMPPLARQTALSLEYFIAENAKAARAELMRLGVEKPLKEIDIRTLPADAQEPALDELLGPVLRGSSAAVMSDAGCPGVADPGSALVQRAHELGIPVFPLVGPSSILLALMASGMNGQRFAFHGYLPIREPMRSTMIETLERESQAHSQTQIFIEAPYRNEALLDAILATCRATTLLCLATNLTLPDQHVLTQPIAGWREIPRPSINRKATVFLLSAAARTQRTRNRVRAFARESAMSVPKR